MESSRRCQGSLVVLSKMASSLSYVHHQGTLVSVLKMERLQR